MPNVYKLKLPAFFCEMLYLMSSSRVLFSSEISGFVSYVLSNLITIILVRHTSYNEDDLKAPSSSINK
jgi:hypothetical protein